MSKSKNTVLRILLTFTFLFTGLASTTGFASADGGDLVITAADVIEGDCGEISFYFEWENGTGLDLYFMEFWKRRYNRDSGNQPKFSNNSLYLSCPG